MRWLAAVLALIALVAVHPAVAQDAAQPGLESGASLSPGAGGLGTSSAPADAALQKILARQRGEATDPNVSTSTTATPTVDGNSAGVIAGQIADGVNNRETYRAIRLGTEDVKTSAPNPVSRVLIQTGGMDWLNWREGPIRTYGGYFLLGVIALLAVFFLIRGRIRIAAGKSGRTILRFTFIERFAHWLLAGSFVLLALTGLFLLFGRNYLIDVMGHDAYSAGAVATKWVHDNVSWAFMVALVLVFFFWVWHNIPSPRDWQWFKMGGGIVGKGHPHSEKFNAGQKVIFWGTILLGFSVSLSGLSLLFPFELPLFAKTFSIIESTGLPGLFGFSLPVELAPQEEMQFAQIWHLIVAFLMMAMILAHIYIGSIGMEGAFDAMGDGKVDYNWAKEHHDLWVARREKKAAAKAAKRGGAGGGAVAPAE
ncbi:formate dehydrogenase subunit gamma [Acuticoccus yangtzensis]|uniref:formate dehydrogenase subunit gamma n=1 Tax=Acuticoccus yangtzensis TaxID=1443441 RepID=UPI0009497B55|nr:formate dehydrogenase subunit gamma [Acuticoccus yangtzensis]